MRNFVYKIFRHPFFITKIWWLNFLRVFCCCLFGYRPTFNIHQTYPFYISITSLSKFGIKSIEKWRNKISAYKLRKLWQRKYILLLPLRKKRTMLWNCIVHDHFCLFDLPSLVSLKKVLFYMIRQRYKNIKSLVISPPQ